MRTIIFRAKMLDKYVENGMEWAYGSGICIGQKGLPVLSLTQDGNFKHIQIKPETIGQFTGVCDCKGVDVYDGDILEAYIRNAETEQYDKWLYQVCYELTGHFNGFSLKPLDSECKLWWEDVPNFARVIGNIHDIPGLVKEIRKKESRKIEDNINNEKTEEQ